MTKKRDNVIPAPDLFDRVRTTMSREGLSNSAAAKEIGVSPPVLSGWLRKTYAGNPENVARRVAGWLAVRDERRRRGAPLRTHAALAVTEEIELLLGHAQSNADCVLVFGAAGSGKSYAARRYAADHSQVALATMSPAVSTALSTLNRVAAAVGFSSENIRSAAVLEDVLVDRLADRNALLIVDEAHHLSQALLDELRCVHDRAECGLALFGNEPLWARLAGGERAAQLVSRIGLKKRLGMPAAADIDALSTGLLGRAVTAAESKALRAAARRAGGLRAVNKIIQTAHAFARGADREQIAADDLTAAIEEAA